MPSARVQLAQAGEGVEVTEQVLGDGGEVCAPAHMVEVREQLSAARDGRVAFAEDTRRLELLQVSPELFSVEVRQRLTFVRVQEPSVYPLLLLRR
jgi:hypothetical protein